MKGRNLETRILAIVLALLFSMPFYADAASKDKFIFGFVYSKGAVTNPILCDQRDLISLNGLVFESVMALDGDMKPKCELALNYSVSGYEYTFNLRENVRFHDGNYLTANDVYATWDYIMSRKETSPYYYRCQYITKMEVVSDTVLKVTGQYKSMLTLYAMTFPVLQAGSLTLDLAVGTGPYWYIAKDLDWIQIDANPFWWKKAPTVDTIYAFRYDETGDALTALSTGEVDAVATRSQMAALGRLLNDRTSIDYTTLTYEMLVPNIKGQIFNDVKTRQALMYAINIGNIAENIYMDMVSESEVPVPTGSWLYEPESAVYFYSLERAYALLMEAGWGDYNDDGILDKVVDGMLVQFDFTIRTYVDDAAGTRTRAAEMIKEDLSLLGINVNVKTVSKSSITKSLKNRDFDMVLCGVNISVLPDLTFIVNASGRMNYSGYSGGSMTQILQRIYETTDESQFRKAFSDLQKGIADELPFLGLFFRRGTLMTTADISGLDAVVECDVLNGFEYITFN